MPTTRDLIRTALRTLGVLASGETVPADQAQDGLETLQALLESWSLERLLIYVIERVDVELRGSQQVYTWGPGGDIDQPRPLRLQGAVLHVLDEGQEWPLEVWTQPQWEAIGLKTLVSTYPQGVYYQPTYPVGTLQVWPVPTHWNWLGLLPWVPLPVPLTLDTALIFPPGYQRLLTAGLTVELAAEYGKDPAASTVAILTQAMSTVKRHNVRLTPLSGDPALQSAGGTFDIFTGTYWER